MNRSLDDPSVRFVVAGNERFEPVTAPGVGLTVTVARHGSLRWLIGR